MIAFLIIVYVFSIAMSDLIAYHFDFDEKTKLDVLKYMAFILIPGVSIMMLMYKAILNTAKWWINLPDE